MAGKCQGLPIGECPNSHERNVRTKICQGDLVLCVDCEVARFPTARLTRSQSMSNHDVSGNSDISTPPSGSAVCISNPVLAYIVYSLQNSTKRKIVSAVAGYYSLNDIVEAKEVLWSSITDSTSYLGDKKSRKGSSSKPASEFHAEDIVDAITKIEKEKRIQMPRFIVEAYDLSLIPRAIPEETLSVSIAERVNSLEDLCKSLKTNVDNLLSKNVVLTERINNVVSLPRYSSAVKSSEISSSEVTNNHTSQSETGQHVPQPKPPHTAAPSTSVRGRGRGRANGRGLGYGRGLQHGRGGRHIYSHNKSQGINRSVDRQSLPFNSYIHDTDVDDDNHSRASSRSRYSHSVADSVADSSEFIEPSYVRKKARQQLRRQILTGKGSAVGGFKGAPEPSRDLFLYRFVQEATADVIKDNVVGEGYEVRDIIQMSHKDAKYKSFRLSVPASQYQALHDAEDFWPEGVRIKQFIPPKHNNNNWI